MENTSGEVVCDSILKNKHKTKSYWEQLMMAALTSEQPGRTPCHSPDGGGCFNTVKTQSLLNLSSNGEDSKPQNELSEQELYEARSQMSLSSPAQLLDSLDTLDTSGTAPKIVENVAKKQFSEHEAIQRKYVTNKNDEESVIEREIRLQREKEEALAKERQEALLSVAVISQGTFTHETSEQRNKNGLISTNNLVPVLANSETKIALELREMRKREELRRHREKIYVSNETSRIEESDQAADDLVNGIPNADEAKCSEYGSENKEQSMDENSRCTMSPEVPVSLNQRTPSWESMGSSHSSGSDEVAGISTRRRVTVKPLAEPEDEDIPVYKRNQQETPIEREIRLAREREDEFRREKSLVSLNAQSATVPATTPEVQCTKGGNKQTTNEPLSVQHKLATGRIQQEINETTQREKELRQAGKIQGVSEDVKSKVSRFSSLTELSVEEREEKITKSVSASHTPSTSIHMSTGANTARPALEKQLITVPSSMSQNPLQGTSNSTSSRNLQKSLGQKGLMQRFIASRGRMNGISSSIVTSSPLQSLSPSHATTSSSNNSTDQLPEQAMQYYESEKDAIEIQRNQTRRGYISAEEKIQVELLDMQKREEELRMQRACLFAQSQPNLLSLVESNNGGEETPGTVERQTVLRSSLSNPNLLDSESSLPLIDELSLKKPSGKTARRRSALIAQWENRIQQCIEH